MTNDPVNPSYYDGDLCMRTIARMGIAHPFCIGTAIKYLWRAGQKGPLEQDLAKAMWYLDWLETRSQGFWGAFLRRLPTWIQSAYTSRLTQEIETLPTCAAASRPIRVWIYASI